MQSGKLSTKYVCVENAAGEVEKNRSNLNTNGLSLL